MNRKTYSQLAAEAATRITEISPWDVPDFFEANPGALMLDVREREEFRRAHIKGAINVPRGILESAAEWDYSETEPLLVTARRKPVVITAWNKTVELTIVAATLLKKDNLTICPHNKICNMIVVEVRI